MSIPEESNKEDETKPVLNLIQDIKDGKLNPKTLGKDLRQTCVEAFLSEGYSVPSMAQILKRSDKTIRRDIDEIREKNALSPDINLAKKIVGTMYCYWAVHRDHLMRLARNKDASVSERAQAEYYAHRVSIEIVSKLQTMGYLPLVSQQLVSDIFWHSDEKALSEKIHSLKGEVKELEALSIDPEIVTELDKIKQLIPDTENLPENKKEGDCHE